MSKLNPWSSRHSNATTRLEAAQDFLAGYFKLHEAALDDGSPAQIEIAHRDVLSATETVLELRESRKRIFLKSWDIDPDKRHLRFGS
jgi:hypothetical protein